MRLASASVVRDSLEATDAPLGFEYCQDLLVERFLTIPWPYRREHADGFMAEYAPVGVTFRGRGPSASAFRGGHPMSWHAAFHATDDGLVKPGWPAGVEAP